MMGILTLSKKRDERDIHSKMGLEISGRGVGSLIELEVPREEDPLDSWKHLSIYFPT
jgi:hypothetical protein